LRRAPSPAPAPFPAAVGVNVLRVAPLLRSVPLESGQSDPAAVVVCKPVQLGQPAGGQAVSRGRANKSENAEANEAVRRAVSRGRANEAESVRGGHAVRR
jgi:hypothetical protein